jgi:hypothetical protein
MFTKSNAGGLKRNTRQAENGGQKTEGGEQVKMAYKWLKRAAGCVIGQSWKNHK